MSRGVFSLENKVVVTTGGSRGIGEEIAVAMAEAGADVIPIARSKDDRADTAARIEATESETMVHPLNITY